MKVQGQQWPRGKEWDSNSGVLGSSLLWISEQYHINAATGRLNLLRLKILIWVFRLVVTSLVWVLPTEAQWRLRRQEEVDSDSCLPCAEWHNKSCHVRSRSLSDLAIKHTSTREQSYLETFSHRMRTKLLTVIC